MNEFRGFAKDERTNHHWTRAEIENGVKVEGYAFFEIPR
jgi:hypothetical protein